MAIFYAFDALPTRAELLRRIARANGDEEDKALVERIIRAAEKANNQRKQVAHAVLAFTETDLDSGMSRINAKSNNRVDPVTLDSMRAMLIQTSGRSRRRAKRSMNC